ncbi:response regulator [Consotaella salsifontis]|uniref:CheY chemotaxis protein or a CheY-like REC (Receiver) domain n=1 Tax=Consotaella salsifontis TaxID=1365950 RepID=A0A1T4MB53_9HYPH|nr:response regulator [Consotaella salsifontis]SJZ64249.1 CheY chemotaxis protein or a CheY-like REC (receiver) domain [Consotaella salsifontis]
MSTDAKVLHGLRVVLVEDEALVAMQLEDMVMDFGCEVVGLAMRLNQALKMIETAAAIDVAILDVNLGGERVYPAASLLRQRGIPIIFATGYGRSGVDEEWQSCPILQKPYTAKQLANELSGVRALPPS